MVSIPSFEGLDPVQVPHSPIRTPPRLCGESVAFCPFCLLPLLVAVSTAVLQSEITVQYNIANQMSKGSGG